MHGRVFQRSAVTEARMVVRLLMHPLAEDVFVFLSLGLILLSAGLIGSLWWGLPSGDVPSPASHRPSITSLSPVSPVSAPVSGLALACSQYSGFSAGATAINCKR